MKLHLPAALRAAILAVAIAFPYTVSSADTYIAEGVIPVGPEDDGAATTAAAMASTRFYDVRKGYYGFPISRKLKVENGDWGSLTDRVVNGSPKELYYDWNTCWRQVSTNVIQYWLRSYGVFYKGTEQLPYGYTYKKEFVADMLGAQSLQVGICLFDAFINDGSHITSAAGYFLGGKTASYSELLNEGVEGSKAYFGNYFGGSKPITSYHYNTKRPATAERLTSDLKAAFGYNTAGKQTTPGQIVYLALTNEYEEGHALTCYGFETGDDGLVKSLYVCNSDDDKYGLFILYVKPGTEGFSLYEDEELENEWSFAGRTWTCGWFDSINTPKTLLSMYTEYYNPANPLVWNGRRAGSVWSPTPDGSMDDALPEMSGGWQVKVKNEYFPAYYDAARAVEFGNAAAGSPVIVEGGVEAARVILSATAGNRVVFQGIKDATVATGSLAFTGAGAFQFSDMTLQVGSDVTLERKATLVLDSARLAAPSLTVVSGSTLEWKGGSSVTGDLTLKSGAKIGVASADGEMPVLSVGGDLGIGGAVSVIFSEALSRGLYTLATFDTLTGSMDKVKAVGLTSGYEWLEYQSPEDPLVRSLILSVDAPSVDFPLQDGTWQDGVDGFFNADLARVSFSGGEITISGSVAPSSVTVGGKKNTVWNGEGSVSGVAKLTKSGSGVLTINTSNSFGGGVYMNGGTLVAGHVSAFGVGRVHLASGTLDLQGRPVENGIVASGGKLSGASDYEGLLTVTGKVTLTGETQAGCLLLNGGALTGGSIADTPITAVAGTVRSVISGDASVWSVGKKVTLSGANSYTGGTVVIDGTLSAGSPTAFGKGGISLQGGTLNLSGKAVANDISATGGMISGAGKYAGHLSVDSGKVEVKSTAQAGSITVSGGLLTGGTIKDTAITLTGGTISSTISGKSSVTVTGEASLTGKLSHTGGTILSGGTLTANPSLTSKQTLSVKGTGNILDGKLTLAGGSIELFDGSALTVSDTLNVKKATTLDVITMSTGSSATISWTSYMGDPAKFLSLGIPEGTRKTYTLDVQDDHLTVSVAGTNTSLTWMGGKGTWEVCGKQMWDGSTTDNRFYHGDDVTFNNDTASTVTLSGRLAPGSVTVSGSGNVTFSGKGSIDGSTDLEMSGAGTLKMNATNTYSGETLIKSGTVVATGADSFGDSYITLTGGTLDFGGKAIANRIIVEGNASILNGKAYAGMIYLAPGGSLSVNANLTGTLVLGGGTLDLSGLAPKALAKLQFGTVRTLGDDVTINVGDLGLGTYTVMNIKDASGLDTTLLQADGLYGSFELQGTKLVLKVSNQPVVAAAEPEAVTAEEPQAAVEVEEALVTDNPAATSAAASPLAAYALSNPRVDGIIYTTQASAQIDGNRAAMDTVRDLMGGARMVVGDRGYRFALQATSANSRVKNDSKGMPGYNRNSIGGLLMVEKGLNDHLVAGLTLGHEHTDVHVRGLNAWRSNDTRLGAHLLAGGSSWRSSSYVGFGLHDYDMKREAATGTYTSKPTGYSLNMMEELAAVVNMGETSVIEPFLRVESSLNGINGTHERGGDADGALGIAHQNAWATTFTLGARYAQELRLGGAMRPARLALEAGVSKSVGDEGAQVDVYSWADRSDSTTLSPAKRDRWGVKLGGSLILPISDAETINLGASVHLRGTGTEVNANVGYSLAF